jgi:hypothetical protein
MRFTHIIYYISMGKQKGQPFGLQISSEKKLGNFRNVFF